MPGESLTQDVTGGDIGLGPVEPWICDFSSTHSTKAFSGALR